MTADPLRRVNPVVRLAPAKLNLTLAVLGRRRDGFHDLHSVAVPLALADRLSAAPAPGHVDTVHATGHDPGPPDANLVLRAVTAARSTVGRAAAAVPLAIRLEKHVPVAAGLGGGSSDAAAALDAALEAWGADVAPADRLAIAVQLGSDVPFFLAGGAALLEGRGERVTPLPGLAGPPPGVLLVSPAVGIETRAAFAAFDAGGVTRPAAAPATRLTSEHLAAEWRAGLRSADLLARAGVLAVANDLASAAAVLVPEIVPFRRALTRVLRRPIGQSGSGPTLWALYPSLAAAEDAAAVLSTSAAASSLPSIGAAPPTIHATTIFGRGADESGAED